MKKIFILSVLFLAIFLIACDSETTELIFTESSIIDTITTADKKAIINDEMDYISALLPRETTSDFILPDRKNNDIDLVYYQDDILVDNDYFAYIPNNETYGTESTLIIMFTYLDITTSLSISITSLANETLYNQHLIDTTFENVDKTLKSDIPRYIESGFTLPSFNIQGLYVEYTVDKSSIHNGNFVYPFPTEDETLNIEVIAYFRGIERTYSFRVTMKAYENLFKIPEIHINTNQAQEVTSKETYVYGDFSLITYDSTNQPMTMYHDDNFRIRCRGNSTYYMPKYSYRLKFSEKTSLLFDYNENDWVILANFTDQTLIRNYLANSLSENMNMEFTPSSAFVDVYINNEYVGNYMLTDQIEVSNDRVNIEEHSNELDTGYLLEMDKRTLDHSEGVEGWDWFNLYGIPYVIKSPKTDKDYYSVNQLYYIEDYLVTTINTLKNGLDYAHLIDESTFIDWFIIEELFKNVDSGYSSIYMYKDKGGLLKMGPVWDFDLSTGNPGHLGDNLRKPEGWYTNLEYKNIWFYYLMEYDSFKENLKNRWNEIYNDQIQSLIDSIYPVSYSISKSRYMNFERWNVIGINDEWYTAPEVLEADTYEKQIEFLYNYLLVRSIWLNQEINLL